MLVHRKLNVGCGFDKREGYTKIDMNGFHEPDLVADITDIHPVPDGAAEEVLAQDVLEHVPGIRALAALVEWNRVLCHGGVLKLRVPELKAIARMLLASPAPAVDFTAMLYGTQAYAGDFHMSGFTLESLTAQLAECGFCLESSDIVHDWMIGVTARKLRSVRSTAFSLAKDARLDPAAYVKAVYPALLGREADAAGLQHFVHSLVTGVRDRYQVIKAIAASDEGTRTARLVT